MITFPNAKINIGLNVVERRADGYHNIETLFYPINLQDALEITLQRPLDAKLIKQRLENSRLLNPYSEMPSEEETSESSCRLYLMGNQIGGSDDDNLVVKAYRLLAADFNIPSVDIHLYKHIPTGAGLGGGSSDAAQMIQLLNRRFGLRMRRECMERYAARLGSDVPFFIRNRAVYATGRGELMEPASISLEGYTIIVVKPEISVNTAQAYSMITPKRWSVPLKEAITRPISEWKEVIFNDFEEPIFSLYPELAELKSRLYGMGALYASMSGSGSAIYGIFSSAINDPDIHFEGLYCRQRELQ